MIGRSSLSIWSRLVHSSRLDTSHGDCEVRVWNNRSPAQNRISGEGWDVPCNVLWAHHNHASRIHSEPSQSPTHRTGQAQLARGIQKQQHALADSITLAAVPKPTPLMDRQVFAW